ncbi:sugar phosphate isomerase/epimerase family protein [Pontibacter beigongshangensis]|uniref:sugar phosphate isomerase/epimerase family protein n=1 Tax=Pontibacter beigongshangensis TaxID=2574733 RepID=UPI00164F72EE|nr:TIM barrel protein [Pontibacter beigongshangensis]
MEVKFFCPRWGCENLPWDDYLQKVRAAGYDGVECAIPNEMTHAELSEIWEKVEQHGLEIIPQHYATYEADFARHHDIFAGWLEKMRPFPALQIDCQTGKDFFSFEQNKTLIDLAVEHTNSTGVEIYHETHRNKFAFAAHITKEYLQKIPYLKITLDASHWVNVAESYLEDQQEALDLAVSRTEHIHARVGYPEGPQVPDPRVPEWQEAVQHHLAWWDEVAKRKRKENSVLTITPEFGPYPYMVALPFTQQPITSQWDVNVYMMQLLRERYQ